MVLRLINERRGSGGIDRWMVGLAAKIGLSDCSGKDEKDLRGTRCWGRMLVKKLESPFGLNEESRGMLRKLGYTSREPEACTQEGVHTLVPPASSCCSREVNFRTLKESLKMMYWKQLYSKEVMLLQNHHCHIQGKQLHLSHEFSNVSLVKMGECRSYHILAPYKYKACP